MKWCIESCEKDDGVVVCVRLGGGVSTCTCSVHVKVCFIMWKWPTFTVQYQTHSQKVALHYVYRSDSSSHCIRV